MEVRVSLETENHKSDFELQNIINAFKPYLDGDMSYRIVSQLQEDLCRTQVFSDRGELLAESAIIGENMPGNQARQNLKKTLYYALSELAHQELPWGVLTGIRPTKIVHNYKSKHYKKSSIKQILIEDYCISREKADLMMHIAEKEEQILIKNKEDEISIYIGIPFCPTRCLYCSFTSYSLEEKGNQIEAYLDALAKEIRYVSKASKGSSIRSLYIGGGTPTSLNEKQLQRLLSEVNQSFNTKEIEEYTVEAGRPDTINREKLKLMKKYGVNRISINPQTMNQKTLNVIGRGHRVEDIVNVFNMAREEGHNNINMDLILGLPGETLDDVESTLERIQELSPENITVHTLAIKRASRLKKMLDDYQLPASLEIEKMLALAAKSASHMEMQAYYMYRQKDIMGNFENVGYARLGNESIYNVQMIAEQQTIIAIGAGAVSKVVYDDGRRIKRIPNVKNLEQYISRIDEMIQRKKQAIL